MRAKLIFLGFSLINAFAAQALACEFPTAAVHLRIAAVALEPEAGCKIFIRADDRRNLIQPFGLCPLNTDGLFEKGISLPQCDGEIAVGNSISGDLIMPRAGQFVFDPKARAPLVRSGELQQ